MEALYGGDMRGFYQRLVPPSYDRDLNRILDKVQMLVDEEDFRFAQLILREIGSRLASGLEGGDEFAPGTDRLANSLKQLDSTLGLDSFQRFRSLDIDGLLHQLQSGQLSRLLKDPELPVEWARQSVELAQRGDTLAVLRVTRADGSDASDEKLVPLVLTEGKWVPVSIAEKWTDRIAAAEGWLDAAIESKREDPRYLRKRIADGVSLLESLASVLETGRDAKDP